MKRSQKILIISLSSIVLFVLLTLLAKNYTLNMTWILAALCGVSFIGSSAMIIKAHTNEFMLTKGYYSNIVGGLIDLFLHALVMLIVWLIIPKQNAIYQAILIGYPLVKFIAAFIDNKFYKFIDQFVYYRRLEEKKKLELEEESKKKAQARSRLKKKRK